MPDLSQRYGTMLDDDRQRQPCTYNGTFCLVNTAQCVFQDKCTNLWTLKVAGGGTTLTSSNGAVYTLSENFNCNGLNSFALAKSPAGSTWQASLTISPTNCNAYPCYPNCTAPPCYALCPNGIAQCCLLERSAECRCSLRTEVSVSFCNRDRLAFSRIPCGSGYTLAITGGTVTLQWGGSVTWSLSGNSTFQCNGSNTFVLTNSPTTGQYPQSVTITPTNCQSPCSPCPPPPTCVNCNNTGKTIAPCWTFTVGGVGGGASGCSGFNTTYYLIQVGECAFSNCTGSTNSVVPAAKMDASGIFGF